MVVASKPVAIETLLERTEGINGGRVCLAGTGISVRQIAVFHNAGRTAEQILEDYPVLDLARIYAAITYYLANQEQFNAEFAEEERDYRRSKLAAETAPRPTA